jgi:hypothetical protein
LSHDSSHSSTLATSTCLDCSIVNTTLSITFSTNSLSLQIKFNSLSIVDVSKCDLDLSGNWLYSFLLGLTSSSLHSTKHAEKIIHSLAATSTSL